MMISRIAILHGAGWTFSGYVAILAMRFGTNIVLARLLAPDIFGAMALIYTIKIGVELTSDVGIGQTIVYNANSDKPDFYNTAWTIQVLRGALLFLLCLALAVPVADFYDIPALAIQISALSFLFSGATSLSVPLAVRQGNLAQRNLYDAANDFMGMSLQIALSYFSPTIWSLVVGGVLGSFIQCVTSFCLPSPAHRLVLKREQVREIFGYGKWIFLSSLILFASSNADRLYLGKAAPLGALGVYGIARSMSELPVVLAGRLCQFIVFPLVSTTQMPRTALRQQIRPLRMWSLLAAAVGLAFGAIVADVFIYTVYDERYWDAAWMLPILLLGAWSSVLCSFNEALLLGLGKPKYQALANALRLASLVVGLPLAFMHSGLLGAVCVIVVSDAFRYCAILLGQMRERFTFARQDFAATLALFALFAAMLAVRAALGSGTPFDALHTPPGQ